MATTVVFDLVGRLVDVFTTALPSVTVYDGYGISEDPGDFLMVGVDDPNSLDSMDSVSAQQKWAGLGTQARYEEGSVTCVALSWNGSSDLSAARTACKAIVSNVENVLRADPNLGGEVAGLNWTGFGTRLQLIQDQGDGGAQALLVFEVDFKARI